MEKLIVHLDSDGPLTDLSTSWCANYNKKYNDNLPVSAFRDWVDIENLVKPECGEKVFDLMKEPGMFARLQPMPGAVECLKRLNANPKLDCYILTSYSGNPEIAHGKLVYFAKHFPFFDPQKIVLCHPKFLAFGHVLVDDSLDNLKEWSAFQSANDLHDHHTIMVSQAPNAQEHQNRVDAVVSSITDAAAYIENILL